MRIFRGMLYVMIGLIAAALMLTALVVSTPFGLRVALAVVDDYLPEALELGPVSGTLAFGAVVEDGAWRGGAVTVEVERLELELAFLPLLRRDLRLDRLRADGVDVEVHAGDGEEEAEERPAAPFVFRMPVPLAIRDGRLEDVSVRWPGGGRSAERIVLSASAQGAQLLVRRLEITSDWLELQADGEARLERPYPVRLDAVWRYLGLEQIALSGSGTIEGDAQEWRVTHRLVEPEAVRTEGTVSLGEDGFRAALRNRLRQGEWELPGDRTLIVEDAEATVEGWFGGYAYDAEGTVRVSGLPSMAGRASGRGTLQALEVNRLVVRSEAGGLEADGRLEVTGAPRWETDFRLRDVEPGAWGAPVDALVSAAGTTSGRWQPGAPPEAAVSLESLSGEYRGRRLGGRGGLALRDGVPVFRDFELDVGENRLRADGRPIEPVDLSLGISAPALSALWPSAQGSLEGELYLRGTRDAPVVDGAITGRGLSWGGFGAGRLDLSAAPAPGGGSRVRIEAEDAVLAGTRLPTLAVNLEGTPAENAIGIETQTQAGVLSLQAAGSLQEGRWQGLLRSLRVERPGLGRWRLTEPASLTVSASGGELARSCLAGEGEQSVCLQARYDPDDASRVEMDIERLPLAVLAPLFPANSTFEGHAAGRAAFTWQAGRLNGDAGLSLDGGLIRAGIAEDEYVTVTIREAGATARIDENRAMVEASVDLGEKGDGSFRLELADLMDAAAPIDGQLRADFTDLALVTLLVPELRDVRGHLMGRVEIGGTRNQPTLAGAIRLREGGFLFADAGIEVTELEVIARQEEPGVIDYEGSARSGEGTVAITGTTRRSGENGWVSRLDVQGENFLIARLPDLEATASPDLDILVDGERVEVRGTLTVPRADVTLRDLGGEAVRPSPDAVVHGRTEVSEERLGPTLSVEIRAVLGEDVQLQGFGLETRLDGSLRLTGGSNRPWLGFGRLSLVDARYEAYGQKLRVERGQLGFSGPLDNPTLDIRAVRDTGEVLAGIRIGGTVRDPESTVFSEPPLPDAEALAYLLTGRPLSGATASESDQLTTAALTLGLSRAGAIASQITQEVGLDTLAVEGGATDGRVLAGKRLSEDLYLEYAWGIFDQIGTLLVRYDLSDRLRLESRSGEQHSVDLIYTVEQD